MSTAVTNSIETSHDREYIKGLGLTSATMLVMGSMIGSGIFLVSAEIAREVDSPALLIGAWVVTAFMTMIAALMLHGAGKPTLARDTMFAVIMLVLNGMVGLILLLGALRHREQQYNLQGAGAYLSVVIPLAVLALVLH